MVLDALNEEPYEPASAAPLRDFTIKTAFLLALASGRRSSELHALGIGDYIIWSNRGVTLHFRPSFLAKNEKSGFSATPVSLPKLDNSAGPRRYSCPVRALKWYLEKTKIIRSERDIQNLFITTGGRVKAAAKTTIAGWVVQAIKRAKAVKGSGNPRAHDARGVASTTAFVAGLSMKEVVDTVSWKTDHVFISTYLKDRPPQQASSSFTRAVLTGKL